MVPTDMITFEVWSFKTLFRTANGVQHYPRRTRGAVIGICSKTSSAQTSERPHEFKRTVNRV